MDPVAVILVDCFLKDILTTLEFLFCYAFVKGKSHLAMDILALDGDNDASNTENADNS